MSHRYRLMPAPEPEAVVREHCAHARFVWNLAVEQQSWCRPGRRRMPGSAERQLAEARAAEPWLREGSSSVQQQALRDFDRAVAAFFDPANPAGRPKFRSGKRGTQGFVVRDTKVRRLNRRWGEVFVPKCGLVRFRWTRALPEKLGMARITLDRSGRWHVSFLAPQPAIDRGRRRHRPESGTVPRAPATDGPAAERVQEAGEDAPEDGPDHGQSAKRLLDALSGMKAGDSARAASCGTSEASCFTGNCQGMPWSYITSTGV